MIVCLKHCNISNCTQIHNIVKWKTPGMTTIKRAPDFKKNTYETAAWSAGEVIAGIDEVGRGCLGGPVVAACVILKSGKKHPLLKDSKLMDATELKKGYEWIVKNSWFTVSIMNNRLIDALNIYQATLRCMQRAGAQMLATCPLQPSLFVVDAMPVRLEHFAGDVIHFYYGEKKSSSIAAASIVAKVTRDALMKRHNITFPGYNFSQHKGYSTPGHKKILAQLPQSLLHRTSYTDHFIDVDGDAVQTSWMYE